MRAQSSLAEKQREHLVDLFETGIGSRAAVHRLDASYGAVRELQRRWKLHGRLCLVAKPTKQAYSFEVKKEVVERFLAGETRMDLATELHLSSPQLVKAWVIRWRRGGDDALNPNPRDVPQAQRHQRR